MKVLKLTGVATILAASIVVLATPGAGAQTATASGKCRLTPKEQKHLGASYVTSLSVKKVTCATGKRITKAFHKCRTANGPGGHCTHRVLKFRCSEKRGDAVPGVQYNSDVTCKRGKGRVFSSYTQNT